MAGPSQRHQKKSILRFGAFVWLVAVAATAYALIAEDFLPRSSTKPVAYLKSSGRKISYRSEDDSKWKVAAKNQSLSDGDRISTGLGANAVIDFGEGRKALLASDTMVSINSISYASGKTFLVALFKGAVQFSVPKEAANQLIVNGGTTSFFIDLGQTRGFEKASGGMIREISGTDRFSKSFESKSASISDLRGFVTTASIYQKIAATPAIVRTEVNTDEGDSRVSTDRLNIDPMLEND